MVCFVPGCKSGNNSKEKTHLFKLPKNATEETRQKWIQNIPKRTDAKFNFSTNKLCFKHFEERFIIKFINVVMGSEIMKSVPRARWTLTADAIPTIFSNEYVPKYFDRQLLPRKSPAVRKPLKVWNADKENVSSQDVQIEMESKILFPKSAHTPQAFDISSATPPEPWNKLRVGRYLRFIRLVEYCNPAPSFLAEKTVEVQGDSIVVYIRHVQLEQFPSKIITNSDEFVKLFHRLDNLKICRGVALHHASMKPTGSFKWMDKWISLKCTNILGTETVCEPCHSLIQNSKEVKKESLKPAKAMSKKLRLARQTAFRKSQRVNQLSAQLRWLQNHMRKADFSNLEDAINREESLSPAFKRSLIVAANVAKAKSKYGVRYQTDWILQSILLKIKSPSAYRYLRDNEILPLPNPNYLTSIISGLDCHFGFSKFVMNQLKIEMCNKPRKDRQFMLSFDEMKIRESVVFDKSEMRFNGFIDYAEFSNEYKSKSTKLEADHALVFMIRSCNSNLTQPIGCFATRGAAPGNILAKMIISAIIQLENAGCEIVGVVSDGAQPNKSAWNILGISGKSATVTNKIPNPVDANRHVHFFCDMPHILKCVRNHMHKHKYVVYNKKELSWYYFTSLFDEDSKHDLRAAPKLTYQHVMPNPFEKMRVSLAAQIYSKAVADALQFYREKCKLKPFVNSEATEAFVRLLNDLFDACNARCPLEGVKVNCPKFTRIKAFLSSMNDNDTFASDKTKESLRVSLQSTLDVVEYLCNVIGYSFVLTAKLNQDCLEKFFGLVRSFGGDDAHPTAESFAHLFRLMSLYAPTSRTLKGNVTSGDNVCVVSYWNSLRSLKTSRHAQLASLKSDLEESILDKIICSSRAPKKFKNSNSSVDSSRNIVYYLCGFLSFKAKSMTDCDDCMKTLQDQSYCGSDASLLAIKDLGNLKRPSAGLFNVINDHIEPALAKKLETGDFSSTFVSDFVHSLKKFQIKGVGCCNEHSMALTTRVIVYYVTIRLYFYSKNHTRNLKSNVQTKRKMKEAKLA